MRKSVSILRAVWVPAFIGAAGIFFSAVAYAASDSMPTSPGDAFFQIGKTFGFPTAALCLVLWHHTRVIEKKDAEIIRIGEKKDGEKTTVVERKDAEISRINEQRITDLKAVGDLIAKINDDRVEESKAVQTQMMEMYKQVDKTLGLAIAKMEGTRR